MKVIGEKNERFTCFVKYIFVAFTTDSSGLVETETLVGRLGRHGTILILLALDKIKSTQEDQWPLSLDGLLRTASKRLRWPSICYIVIVVVVVAASGRTPYLISGQ